MPIWIISAGDEGRDYRDAFLDHGIAFVGGDKPRAKMRQVRRGDLLLLKKGVKEFVAAGTVVARDGVFSGDGDKSWLRDFDGWDPSAYCYVDWHALPHPEPVMGLSRGTIYKSSNPVYAEVAERLLSAPECPRRREPAPTNPVSDDEILSFIRGLGQRVPAVDDLTDALRRIRLLAEFYYTETSQPWAEIREHETRTFLVVPLLLALGWTEPQIKIELPIGARHGRVDIAGFPGTYRGKADEATVLIETKGFSAGLLYAPDQAIAYARHFPNCRAVLVTNGHCYRAYLREETGEFNLRPAAYLNIRNPRDRDPLDPERVGGALDLVKRLMPACASS